jgi:hypothetical protein
MQCGTGCAFNKRETASGEGERQQIYQQIPMQ